MKLTDWRRSKGLTLTAVAGLVEVSASTILRIEKGTLRPRGDLALKIHEVTAGEVTPNDIYGVVNADQVVPPKRVAGIPSQGRAA